jgi:MFS family permease
VDTVLLIAIVFVWAVVFVVGTGWIAERKGRSFAGFAILGLFLGLIGLLIALLVPSTKEKKAERAAAKI